MQSTSKKDTKTSSALTAVSFKPSLTQITPSLSAPTVTTQVRSRPLPAILPAPPKPLGVSQVPTSVSTTPSVRKLPTILPAPAKNIAVFPTVLVPLATGVGSHAGAQLQSPLPLAVSTPAAAGVSGLSEIVGQQYPSVVSTSQDTGLIAADQGNPSSKMQEISDNSEISGASGSKVPVLNEQTIVAECDNNTSSEDDSLLMCSETIDSGCSITEVPSAMDFFPNMAESTPVKDEAEQGTDVMPQTIPESTCTDERETALDPLSLQDIEVSDCDLDCGNSVQQDLIHDTKPCKTQPETVAESVENVTVQRLDDTSEISELIRGGLSENIYSESLQMAEHEEEKAHKPVVESDLCSSFGSTHCDNQNLIVKGQEDGVPVENTAHPVDDALQIIESFVESMEANSGDKSEAMLSSDDLPLEFLQSSTVESSALPEAPTTVKENLINEQISTQTETDKGLGEDQTSNVLPRFEEESGEVSDALIDVLSTSTSSSNSASESPELTERELKALEAFGSIRTSGRKRKPPTSLDASPPRQVSGWVRGALRYVMVQFMVSSWKMYDFFVQCLSFPGSLRYQHLIVILTEYRCCQGHHHHYCQDHCHHHQVDQFMFEFLGN